jgi:hypothetical protein
MILPFRKPTANLGADKKHLANTVMELFAGRPHIDKMLAISAGHRALERGTPFFDAVEIAEGVLNVWDEIEHLTRRHLMVRRNRERLTEYRIRRSVFLRPPCG